MEIIQSHYGNMTKLINLVVLAYIYLDYYCFFHLSITFFLFCFNVLRFFHKKLIRRLNDGENSWKILGNYTPPFSKEEVRNQNMFIQNLRFRTFSFEKGETFMPQISTHCKSFQHTLHTSQVSRSLAKSSNGGWQGGDPPCVVEQPRSLRTDLY